MTTLSKFLSSLTLSAPSSSDNYTSVNNASDNNAGDNNSLTDAQAVIDILMSIATVGKDITNLLRQGALANIHGEAGNENVQGEVQKKLDVISNDILIESLTTNPYCAGVASEELDHATPANKDGELLVLFDPLDGSSNIDINMPVGTIFSILPYNNSGRTSCDADFLQKGTEQLASGYLLYGSSTILTLTLNTQQYNQYNHGVVMFGLDPLTGDYVLLKENIAIAADTKEYAINSSNYRYWHTPIQQYVNELIAGHCGKRNKDFNMRWVAAMVGDVHRILCRGGVFLYPADTKDPQKAGKLRLMYEANPMSLLVEQAGGSSTDALHRIMDYQPTHIHQRVPVVLGSRNEVAYIKDFHIKSNPI